MLTAIRDRATGWIAYLIIFLISIPFALWGINSFFEGGGDDRVAAIVNGQEIPVRDFLTQFQQQKRYIQSVLGQNAEVQYSDELIKGDVIRSMVQSELVRQQVDKSGFRVSDATLSQQISQNPSFSVDGRFSPERYKAWLQSRRQSAAQFESEMRQRLRIQQFNNGIVETAFVPPAEKKRFIALQNQQREVSYFTITEEASKYRDAITEEEIKEFYENNSGSFQRPEQVKVSYIEVDKQQIQNDIDVNEDTLRQVYEQEPERFSTEEKRKVRQILLTLPQGSPSSEQYNEEFAKKEKLIEELLESLRNGEDFSKLAGEYSEDSETATSGGELGFVSRSDLDETLAEAVFDLEAGTISDPIATSLGIHIVEVQKIKPPVVKPFDDVRDEIEQEYRSAQAEERYYDLASTLQDIAFERPDSLQASSDATGLPIKHSDWFSRLEGTGIARHDMARQAAFGDTVLTQGRNSEVLEIDDGYALVLRLDEHQDAEAKPLEEVKDDVRDVLAAMKATDVIEKMAEQALTRLKDGDSMQKVAEETGAELESPGFVTREDNTVPPLINSKLFTMNQPGNDPAVDSLKLSNGDRVIIELKTIKPGDADDTETESAAQESLDSDYGAREWQALLSAIEAESEVRILKESLDNL